MNIGIIASSGGSVFREVYSICKALEKPYSFFVITDRACGIEEFCKENQIRCMRIECKDNNEFSLQAREKFDSIGKINCIVLFFLRIISGEIHRNFPTFNIHPSLLPAFSGFNPVKRAYERKVKFIGASLHFADDSVDNGRIVAQICNPVSERFSEKQLNTLSFLQKVYLFLLVLELLDKGLLVPGRSEKSLFTGEPPVSINANPCISDLELIRSFLRIQEREGMDVIK